MSAINFIAADRRELTARRARLRAWALATAGCAILATFGCALCAALAAGEDRSVVQKLAQLPAEIERASRSADSLQTQLAEAQARLDAARAVAQQPDWSILLGLLAGSLGDDIVLTSCRLDSAPLGGDPKVQTAPPLGRAPAPAPAAGPAGRFTLTLAGLGRTQADVAQFVLRLERIGMFESVTMLKAGRQIFGDNEAIAFQLEATLGGAAAGATTGGGAAR